MKITNKDRARAVYLAIRSHFPKTPYGKLILALTDISLRDLAASPAAGWAGIHIERNRKSAREFFLSDPWYYDAIDIKPEWIRRVIRMSGLKL
jgi:hypothetical protein